MTQSNDLTVAHLVKTVDAIEQWAGLVKQALMAMDQNTRIRMIPQGKRVGGVREAGSQCYGVIPKEWEPFEEDPP